MHIMWNGKCGALGDRGGEGGPIKTFRFSLQKRFGAEFFLYLVKSFRPNFYILSGKRCA